MVLLLMLCRAQWEVVMAIDRGAGCFTNWQEVGLLVIHNLTKDSLSCLVMFDPYIIDTYAHKRIF